MKKLTRREAFTIPNVMCYFRILLIPIFAAVYLSAASDTAYYISAAIIGLSAVTDFLDGKIARKFHMITELGKFLDPLADKLTQGALILCLSSRYPLMWGLVALFLIKEGFMAVAGALMLRHNGKKLDGAMWFGKLCTAVLYLVMFLLLLFPSLPITAVYVLIFFCGAVMLFTLCKYFPIFKTLWSMPKQ